MSLPVEPKTILLVRLGALGDVIQTLPAVRQIQLTWPNAKLVWAIEEKAKSLIQHQPGVEALIFPKSRVFSKNPAIMLYHQIRFRRILRSYHFDLAIDLQGLFKSGWIAGMSGAPVRIGFSKKNSREGNHLFLTQQMPAQDLSSCHRIDFYQSVIPALGYPLQEVDDAFAFTYSAEELASAKHLLHRLRVRPKHYVAINLGTSRLTKRWKTAYFIETINLLQKHWPKLGILLLGGGPADALVEMEVLKAVTPGTVLSSVNRITLRELAMVVRLSRLMISADSLALHLATAQGIPAVGVFGGAALTPLQGGNWRNPGKSLASSISCFPCRRKTCSHHSCMQDLNAGLVFAEISKVLNS